MLMLRLFVMSAVVMVVALAGTSTVARTMKPEGVAGAEGVALGVPWTTENSGCDWLTVFVL